jgi:hypothetical protein
MNQNHEPTLRIHGPVDLVSAVPFLLRSIRPNAA